MQIRFSHNWNNKLDGKIFTTIRKHDKEKANYYFDSINKVFTVMLNNKAYSIAKLRGVYVESISNFWQEENELLELLLFLDTGMMDMDKILELFKKFGVEDKVIVLLFETQLKLEVESDDKPNTEDREGGKMKAKPFFDEIDPKYKKLVEIYHMAYDRAAVGKGAEHHSQGESYEQQWILRGARMFGIGGLQFQIGKKNEQIAKMLKTSVDKQAVVMEFLDIINYAAASILFLKERLNEKRGETPSKIKRVEQ